MSSENRSGIKRRRDHEEEGKQVEDDDGWSSKHNFDKERTLEHEEEDKQIEKYEGRVEEDEEEEEEEEEELDEEGKRNSSPRERDSNGEDGEDENGYRWRFGDGIDPLAMVEDDASGAQPYQQFERLEYEALAARKRESSSRGAKESQKAKGQELFGASIDEIWEASGFGSTRGRKRKTKKRGRRAANVSAEVTEKLGNANLLYAMNQFDEAVNLLKEVVRLAPNMPDPYHTLGLVHNAMGNRKKAINFYMLAAHLTPKDASLWKRLASWSIEEESTGQAVYCLRKATKADPEDVHVKWELASLFAELKDYAKAAETYEAILTVKPTDVEVCKMVAKMHHQSGRIQEATQVLRQLIDEHPTEADLTVVNLLADLHMKNKDFSSAISCIEQARKIYCSGQGIPLDLAVKAGICNLHLGNDSVAQRYFEALGKEQAEEFSDLLLEVGDAYVELGHHHNAFKYYATLDGITSLQNKNLWLKMAQCHVAMKEPAAAVALYHKAVSETPHDVDVRLRLASLLQEINKLDEASSILQPVHTTDSSKDEQSWWLDGRVILMLAKTHYLSSKFDLYLEMVLPLLQKALEVEIYNQKVKGKKRLPKSVLLARVKLLDDDGQFERFIRVNPIISGSEKLKASRARRALAKLEARKEEKRAAVLAAGLDWQSEDEIEPEVTDVELKVQPIPKLFDDEEHFQILVQTCKLLATKKQYGEAFEIVNQALKIGHPNVFNKRAELRSLGAEIAFKARDAKHGYECVRYIAQQQPYSLSAWNWYYQAVSSSETRIPRHNKFILTTRSKHPDCVPPMIICGHQFSMISQPQGALREYLQAYKLQPEDPFVNLCVGISFINLSLGFRLTNRNQCVMQGFAFLHNYQRLSDYSQESNYNLARAYHHVGFVTLAVDHYEKVLSHFEKEHPIPKDSFVLSDGTSQKVELSNGKSFHSNCDLRKEAAYNLHLIYRTSGADDLARQVLQDYCTP